MTRVQLIYNNVYDDAATCDQSRVATWENTTEDAPKCLNFHWRMNVCSFKINLISSSLNTSVISGKQLKSLWSDNTVRFVFGWKMWFVFWQTFISIPVTLMSGFRRVITLLIKHVATADSCKAKHIKASEMRHARLLLFCFGSTRNTDDWRLLFPWQIAFELLSNLSVTVTSLCLSVLPQQSVSVFNPSVSLTNKL